MRRALSILFVLLFGLGPLAATVGAVEDQQLPACCRRNGAHHCQMPGKSIALFAKIMTSAPTLTAPAHCPIYPGIAHALLPPMHALAIAQAGHHHLTSAAHWIAAPLAEAIVGPRRNAASRAPPSLPI